MNSPIRLRVITSLSAMLEFFDFSLLIFLAPVIASNFFPPSLRVGDIMPVLILFFAGYLARFVGGLLFAHGGDTLGRKRYYMLSIIVMSLSTFGIAILPTHDTLGAIAPMLLLILRIVQGLSLGGEIPGSVVYASEYTQQNRRGLVTGLVIFGVTLGNALAAGVVSFLFHALGEQGVYQWGWRIPFLIGSSLGLISIWLRYTLTETPTFEAMEQHKRLSFPSFHLLQKSGSELLRGVMLSGVPAAAISVLFFMPRYQHHYLGLSQAAESSESFYAFFLLAIMALGIAILSDRLGRMLFIRLGAAIMLIVVPVSIYLMKQEAIPPFLAICPLLIAAAMIMGVYEASMVELFSTEARYTGVAFCHNLGFGLFGGFTPMLLEWLCKHGFLLALGIWPALSSLFLLLLTFRWYDRYQYSLQKI